MYAQANIANGARVILEIGCGDKPQPPATMGPGDLYLASDIAPVVQEVPAEFARMRSDARKLPLSAASVDCALARNVFGDVGLGFTPQQLTGCASGEEYAALVQGLMQRRQWGRLELLRARMRAAAEQVWEAKLAMLREFARVLKPHGCLVVIETLTPQHALAFMKRLATAHGARVGSLSWAPLDGYRRRRKFCSDAELADPGLQVWTFEQS